MSVGHEKGCDRTMAKVTKKTLLTLVDRITEVLTNAGCGVRAVLDIANGGYAVDLIATSGGSGATTTLIGRTTARNLADQMWAWLSGAGIATTGYTTYDVVLSPAVQTRIGNLFGKWLIYSGWDVRDAERDSRGIPRVMSDGSSVCLTMVPNEAKYAHATSIHSARYINGSSRVLIGPMAPAVFIAVLEHEVAVMETVWYTRTYDLVRSAYSGWVSGTDERARTWYELKPTLDRGYTGFRLVTTSDGSPPNESNVRMALWDDEKTAAKAIEWFIRNTPEKP